MSYIRQHFKPPLGRPIELGHPLSKGLIGYWLINEIGGNSVLDLSGNRNTGTLVATAAIVGGRIGPAVSLDGNSDFITVADAPELPTTSLTISMWVYATSLSGDSGLACHTNNGDAGSGWWWWMDGANMAFTLVDTDDYTVGIPLSTNTWHHLVAIYDGGSQDLWVYRDLAAWSSLSTGADIAPVSGQPLMLGAVDNAYGSMYFTGLIDNVMLWNRALSVSELTLLNQSPLCMLKRDPIELWYTAPVVGGIVVLRRRRECA